MKSEPQGEHLVPKPFLVVKNISNKEMGRLPKRMLVLDKPSLIVIANIKIKIAYAQCNAIDTFCL
jgi:hypothetical protein